MLTDPAKPENLNFGAATSKSIEFCWEKPIGKVDKYEIEYYPDGETARLQRFEKNATADTKHELYGLESGTSYDIYVRAMVGNLRSSMIHGFDITREYKLT